MTEEERGGLIYGIKCPVTKEIRYIGITTASLEKRKSNYKSEIFRVRQKRPVIRWFRIMMLQEWEFEDIEFVVIREYSDISREDLKEREQWLIQNWEFLPLNDASGLLNVAGLSDSLPATKLDWRTLSPQEVREIREERHDPDTDVTYDKLADKYGVSKGVIRGALSEKSYPDAGGPTGRVIREEFSDDEVKALREEFAENDMSIAEMARREDCLDVTMGDLLRGDTYEDAGGPIKKREPFRKFNSEEVEKLREEYHKEGKTAPELAGREGVSVAAIYKLALGTTYEDAPGPTSNPLDEERVEKVRRDYHYNGKLVEELAEREGVSASTIYNWVTGRHHKDAPGPTSSP